MFCHQVKKNVHEILKALYNMMFVYNINEQKIMIFPKVNYIIQLSKTTIVHCLVIATPQLVPNSVSFSKIPGYCIPRGDTVT